MTNIHNHNPRKRLEAIQESDKITEQNKEDMAEFYSALKTAKKGKARRERYLSTAKQILEYEENDFRLKDASERQIEKIDDQIDSSAYYIKEYSPETKKEYRKFLRIFFKWSEKGKMDRDTDVPEKVDDIKAHVSEEVKDRTSPHDLPDPDDIKMVCQNLPLRLRALYLTHWDLGSRINETLRIKVEDYTKKDGKSYIYVPVNTEESEEGSKSPRRNCRVKVASPAIDRWLEEEHPNPEDEDAYLFCRTQKVDAEDESQKHSYRPVSYNLLVRKLRELSERLEIESDISTHTVRKARTTFMNNSLGMGESEIDKRIGHIVKSQVTRDYLRLDDEDANSSYGEGYGEENPEENEIKDLVPLTCEDCEEVNAGYRDRCYKCNGLLEIRELEKKELRETKNEARELLWDALEERGMLEDIQQLVEEGGE